MTFRELIDRAKSKGSNLVDVAIGTMMTIIAEETGVFPDYDDEAPEWVMKEVLGPSYKNISEDIARDVFDLVKDMDWRDYYDSRSEGERDFRNQIKNHPETVVSMLKEVDDDSPYYNKAQELILKLTNKNENINEEFEDKFYIKLVKAIDNDANTLRDLYEEGDKAPVTILHNMDYYEDKNNDYKLVNTSEVDGRKYSQVFDFTPFENGEAYVEYYVLVDDEIPNGFTKTKLIFDFDLKPKKEEKEEITEDYYDDILGETKRDYENGLWVCDDCLQAIESHEGNQATMKHWVDEEDPKQSKCDWCKESGFNELYEIL